ncbi:hypothetical protein [Bifidobacterium magnum]|uniref:Putative transcriptional regulator n=1 Tax=Bifidobacterium magnum TaxID=1692 RepID=A0A087BE77_9BIFI|nr:hypothetical protein [Bifidobacterium magnum]KFI69327.1 putative transcriptional regulator [Bifidobacterium magnum]
MKTEKSRLLGAAEVSERLGVCRSKAYKIIQELNSMMESKGYKTIPGRVGSKILEETYFSKEKGCDGNDR